MQSEVYNNVVVFQSNWDFENVYTRIAEGEDNAA